MIKISVNYTSERYFGAMIGQIQSYDKIGTTNAGGVSQARVDDDLSREFDTGFKNK